MKICSVEGCSKPVRARGWCATHWGRWRRNGSPTGGQTAWGVPHKFYADVVLHYDGDDCLIWPYGKDRNGYAQVNLKKGEVPRSRSVCRMVCEQQYGPDPRMDAAHSCGKGHLGCVNPKHLRWATRLENMREQYAHGTRAMGERHGHAKLKAEDVITIRSLKGKALQREVAEIFGVCRENVRDIQNGKAWSWLAP